MKKEHLIIVAIILSFLSYKFFFAGSEKEEINKVITELKESVEYEFALAPLDILSRLKKINSLLDKNFAAAYESEQRSASSKNISEIKNYAAIGAKLFSSIDIMKTPSLISLSGKSASASFHITISGEDKHGTDFRELFAIEMDFLKSNGEWKCSKIFAKRQTPED